MKWELRSKARTYYPTSLHMQHQWVRKTVHLLKSGKHVLQTGKFAGGR